ncbi:MAG: LON peptidase substrate-binding domain-containing protein [Gammaproteobacteria bacterium]
MAELPVFPLSSVLFPQGQLALRIFEPRYVDMVSRCLRGDGSFGICLIAEGNETGVPATPHAIGTEAVIVDWDRHDDGLLGLTVRGGRRFQIESRRIEADKSQTADVIWLEDAALLLPDAFEQMADLLRQVLLELQPELTESVENFSDANWVSYRLAECLPIPVTLRQQMLADNDPVHRLKQLASMLHKAAQSAGH